MLGLPTSTEFNKPIAKEAIYKKFELSELQRRSLDEDISAITIVNLISARTVPAITAGEKIKDFYVMNVELKTPAFRKKNIEVLTRLIPQNVIFVLSYDGDSCLAVNHSELFIGPWSSTDELTIPFEKQNLDNAWQEIIEYVGNFSVGEERSLAEAIEKKRNDDKLKNELVILQKRLTSTVQAHKKRELFIKIQKIKEQLNIQ